MAPSIETSFDVVCTSTLKPAQQGFCWCEVHDTRSVPGLLIEPQDLHISSCSWCEARPGRKHFEFEF